tara:strand:+ start:922 stop:5631 length:4710 start_codon:yes stop_codon:yes gene_type:complete
MEQPRRKRVTLTEPLVVSDITPPEPGEAEEPSYKLSPIPEQKAPDPRIPKQLPGPAETAKAVGGFVGETFVKPVLRTGQFVKGAALGVQSIFDHIVSGLAANEAMNGLLLRLENPNLTQAQRDAIIDQMEDTENILVDESPLYKVYKEVDNELDTRFKNNSSYTNAISDFGEVVSTFPMMVKAFVDAAYDEDPETMEKLGFMMTGGGVISTVATLNPNKIGRNFDARPASVILGLSPTFGIVARSPKALQVLRGKFGKQTDVLLRAVETFDNTVRSGMAKVAESELPGRVVTEVARPFANVLEGIPTEATRSVAAGLRGFGKTSEDVVRVGEAKTAQGVPGVRGQKPRVTELFPGQRFLTVGDIGDSFISGAKKGLFAGEFVAPGLVFAAARVLYPNTRLTRSIQGKVGRLLRHTSAQSGAPAELAVRGLMMASAEQRNRMRSIADRIGKAIQEEGPWRDLQKAQERYNKKKTKKNKRALDKAMRNWEAAGKPEPALSARKGDRRMDVFFEGEPFQPGQRRKIDYEFTESGQEFLVSQAEAKSALKQLEEAQASLLEAQQKPGSKKHTNQQIRSLNAQIKSLKEAIDSDAKAVFPNQTLRQAVDDLGAVLDEAGVGSGIELVKNRLANVADRNAILLQNGDIAELVIRAMKRRYGNRLLRAGVTDSKLRKLISDHAEEPYFGSSRLSATIDIEGIGRINLDDLTRQAFNSLKADKQREVMGQVASNAALRYSQLVTEASKGRAIQREATKLGIGKALEGVPLDSVQPQVYAVALARTLARKDLTRGGVSLPQAIPKSASGPSLAAALRDIASDSRQLEKILRDELGGDFSFRERQNLERVLRQSADEVIHYVSDSPYARSFTDELKRSIADNTALPDDVRKLARDATVGEYAYSPGLAGTLTWLDKYQAKPGFWRDLVMLFKGNATVRNIIPHINNSVSGIARAMLSGDEGPRQFVVNSYRDALVYLDHKAGKLGNYRKNTTPGSEEYFTNRAAVAVDESGVGNTDFVAGELLRSTRANLTGENLSDSMLKKLLTYSDSKLGYIPSKLNNLASRAYAAEDNLPKVHIGMDRARQTFRDLFELEPGAQVTIQTSPVSTRTLFKDKAGNLREGKPSNPGRLLSENDINKIVAADVRRHVQKFVVSYDERSGLNRFVVSNPALAPFNPFFTFTDKAAGLGGRKGFVEHLLFPEDGLTSTSPKVALRQIKQQAALAARRAVLVNSFQTLASTQENLLAQALAFDPGVPNKVIFEMLTDPDAMMYRDISGMSVFGPGEVKYRAYAWAMGNMMKMFGIDKRKDLTAKQKRFFNNLNNGEVANIGTIGSIFGVDRGPGLSALEIVINKGRDRYGEPLNLVNETIKRVAPFAVPAPLAVALRELVTASVDDLAIFSGRQMDIDDVQLNEERTDYLLRRFLLQGGRKIRFAGSTKSVMERKIRRIEDHEQVLRKQLETRLQLLTNEKRELERQIKKNKEGGNVPAGMQIEEEGDIAVLVSDLTKKLEKKKKAIENTTNNMRSAYRRLAVVTKEEIIRLKEAYEQVQRIGSLSKRLRARMPTEKVRSLQERRRIMKEAQ